RPVVFTLSPDGRFLAAAREAGITLFEVETGQPVLDLAGHPQGVACLAFRPDGDRLVSGGTDGSVLVWSLAPTAAKDKSALDDAWRDLGGDAKAAYRASATLTRAGAEGAAFLAKRLQPG